MGEADKHEYEQRLTESLLQIHWRLGHGKCEVFITCTTAGTHTQPRYAVVEHEIGPRTLIAIQSTGIIWTGRRLLQGALLGM